MTSENVTEPGTVEPSVPQPSRAVDDRLIDELVSRAQAEGWRHLFGLDADEHTAVLVLCELADNQPAPAA